jgi:hypothetical protein
MDNKNLSDSNASRPRIKNEGQSIVIWDQDVDISIYPFGLQDHATK